MTTMTHIHCIYINVEPKRKMKKGDELYPMCTFEDTCNKLAILGTTSSISFFIPCKYSCN
jgi:hypothetical protein